MHLLAGARTAEVIWFLQEGERCFTELQHDISGVSAKVLTNCLRKLEREGIIERISRPTSPPTVWYSLTTGGQEMRESLTKVVEIAQQLTRAKAGS